MKIISVNLIVSFFLLLLSSALYAQEKSWKADPVVVERLSKSRQNVNYYEEKVPAFTLPDPLISNDGKKITSAKEWKTRRAEILELFRVNVYGRVPNTPYKKVFKVVNEDKNAMGGAATLKQVDIIIEAEKGSLPIHLSLFVPNNVPKPVPVILLINNREPSNIDPTRKVKSEFWPAEEVIARGYGIAAFYNDDVDNDQFDNFNNKIHALLDKQPRPDDAWGTIAAWAWGASRCLDYLVTDKNVDKDKVAVVGHSRGGKTSLWAGAEDERFAMVISNESGTTGASLARRRFGETVERINTSFPHWFCTNYKKYNNNEDALPVDQHELLALIAPRALYVACASEDLWGDPKGSYLALYNALPVFRLLGTRSQLPEAMPPLNKPVRSGVTGFHVRSGTHNMLLQDWNAFMDMGDMVWKRK
jgi:pimeloyl-ACP methyl ester carboxylesterase